MLRPFLCLTISATMFLVVSPIQADWDPGDPFKMHYPQLPDLTPEGMDVLAGLALEPMPAPALKVLADDFLCTATGAITDVHIWGSWLQDAFPPAPDHGTFVLGIYDDIPAGAAAPWSMPGNLLWQKTFRPGEYQAREYAFGQELFYDPNIGQIIGQDNVAWQYNFLIDESQALVQEEGKIYWLAVANVDPNNDGIVDLSDLGNAQMGTHRFGWKTSQDHFNDDAVYIDVGNIFGLPTGGVQLPPGVTFWEELRYPSNHPFAGESIDLAFVITPEPASVVLTILGALAVLRRR